MATHENVMSDVLKQMSLMSEWQKMETLKYFNLGNNSP
jgi:hypothetical protein